MGPENVRAILAGPYSGVGSRADIAVGAVQMTKGFAQEWLAWQDREKAKRESTFRTAQTFWYALGRAWLRPSLRSLPRSDGDLAS